MSITNFLDGCKNKVSLHDKFSIDWSVASVGFGQLYFYTDENGTIHCESETMGKEFIKMVLCRMVDDCVVDS